MILSPLKGLERWGEGAKKRCKIKENDPPGVPQMASTARDVLIDEITDFFLSQPMLEEIIANKASEAVDARSHELLDKNRNCELSPDERREMNRYLEINHFFIILKVKARLKLRGDT